MTFRFPFTHTYKYRQRNISTPPDMNSKFCYCINLATTRPCLCSTNFPCDGNVFAKWGCHLSYLFTCNKPAAIFWNNMAWVSRKTRLKGRHQRHRYWQYVRYLSHRLFYAHFSSHMKRTSFDLKGDIWRKCILPHLSPKWKQKL